MNAIKDFLINWCTHSFVSRDGNAVGQTGIYARPWRSRSSSSCCKVSNITLEHNGSGSLEMYRTYRTTEPLLIFNELFSFRFIHFSPSGQPVTFTFEDVWPSKSLGNITGSCTTSKRTINLFPQNFLAADFKSASSPNR